MNNANMFFQIIYDIYGTYHDSLVGFQCWRDKIIEMQKRSKLPISEADKRKLIYGHGNPNKKDSYKLHISTQGGVKERNKNNGKNSKIIGNLCLVSIYNYWEYYRSKIEKENNLNKNEIRSDLMADIGYFRNSILKHDGRGNHEMKKCKVLKWFKKGEEIFITKERFEEIIKLIEDFVEELNRKYYTEF